MTISHNPITPTPRAVVNVPPPRVVPNYVGEVVYIYAFDIGYDMSRRDLNVLLGQPVAHFSIDTSKRNPRQLFFYRAQMVRLPALERIGPRGPLRLERSIKILPVGAISITVRVPFQVERLEDLVHFHDLRFNNGQYLYDEVLATAEEVRKELAPYIVRPRDALAHEEAYTVFCVRAPMMSAEGEPVSAEEWLDENRRAIASVLTEESDLKTLSTQEAEETTSRFISYYGQDLAVVDWDAALVVDEPRNFAETVYLMELANVQLAELEAYDALLDDATDRAYRDLQRRHPLLGRDAVQRSLREIRLDMSRMSDELQNITKFFGDWHLARIYKAVADRFHLADWHRSIDEKLKTIDDLYQILQADRTNRMMVTLEALIVLLFVIDLVMIFMLGGH